ncbi:TetR/AcrR family transcriptional regulator [Saccharopolyspora elongata]|uniref:TetR/AcrR family transcriptional regulator n=1 Tax=Saccharopolyspora elongata TaxID=2530387 RepID=A0A4R4Y6X4_9PSEU|nr:TetR/AcrR family transcriptional regulator [Saccharopolyspora elongata]TDD38742.1 TetR/AcrR family transcriptional regulator [Saccharopolyspora elongata]
MPRATASARPPGRPRAGIDAEVFAATLSTVDELGYAGATMDRIAAAAGVAKTTIYRRWPSKGALIADCLVDALGPVPLTGTSREEDMASAIHWVAAKIGEPGMGAAFAGVFVDAVSDPALREVLSTRLQDPYRIALQEALGEPENRVLLLIDVVVGTLLHRMGMTGAPMVDEDVTALAEMVLRHFADPA